MITKRLVENLRKTLNEGGSGELAMAICEDGSIGSALLDAAEFAHELAEQVERYRRSIAITDKNFRALQDDRDTLRDLSNVLVDELDDRDGREFMHRNASLSAAWKALRDAVRK